MCPLGTTCARGVDVHKEKLVKQPIHAPRESTRLDQVEVRFKMGSSIEKQTGDARRTPYRTEMSQKERTKMAGLKRKVKIRNVDIF